MNKLGRVLAVSLMASCGGTGDDLDASSSDAAHDQSVPDVRSDGAHDASPQDVTTDEGPDVADASDASTTDAPDDVDDSSTDAPADAGQDATDGGDDAGLDGGLCGVCKAGYACCTIPKAFAYGKCYDKLCLACCM